MKPQAPDRSLAITLSGLFILSALIGFLQYWSKSEATALEIFGRPLFVAVFIAVLLSGRSWARWVLAVSAFSHALWFAGSALTVIFGTTIKLLLAFAAITALALAFALLRFARPMQVRRMAPGA